MEGRPRYAELRDYLRVVRQQRAVIVALGVLFAAVAFAMAAREEPVYETSTDLAVRDVTQGFSLLGEQPAAAQPPERLAALTAQAVTSREVVDDAARQLRDRYSRSELRGRVEARVEAATNLVDVRATGETPRMAARIANAFARATVTERRREEVRRIQTTLRSLEREVRTARRQVRRRLAGADIRLSVALQRLSQLRTVLASVAPVTIADVADVPSSSVSPRPVRDTLLGLLIGLTLGLVVAFVRDVLDRRMRTPQDVEQELDLPLVGRVSAAALGTAGPATRANGHKVNPADAEAFRMLRANLDFLARDEPLKLVVVTSGLPEEGKSTVAASVAATEAATGRRTLLLECDLRRPTIGERLGLDRAPGFTDLLAGRATRDEAVRRVPVGPAIALGRNGSSHAAAGEHGATLDVLTAGEPHPQPAELLGSDAGRRLLEALRAEYDRVIVDTSPLLSVADTLALVPVADAVLLCVRAMRTTRDQAQAARAALARLPERPTALVVTGVRPRDDEAYGYYAPYEDTGARA
jgi:capsular exopolysaccharide synthesis family protein